MQRPFEPLPLDELARRLPEQRLEDALEVVRRNVGRLGHRVQAQGLRQVAHYVVDRAIHALDVRRGEGHAVCWIGPQDMASRWFGSLAS